MRASLSALLLALAMPAMLSAGPGPAAFQLSSLNFNSAEILQFLNTAKVEGVGTNFTLGTASGLVSAQVRNTGGTAGICYFRIQVSIPTDTYGCGGPIAVGPVMSTNSAINPGQAIQVNASNIVLLSQNVTVCQNFQNQINNEFGGGNGGNGPSPQQVSQAFNLIRRTTFQACLIQTDSGGNVIGGETCTNFTLFSPPPGATTCPNLLSPATGSDIAGLPTFAWTPANYQGRASGFNYQLNVATQPGGPALYTVNIPTQDQTFYAWQAGDQALTPGQKYYAYVIAKLASNGNVVGGQNGQGFNTDSETYFTVGGSAPIQPTNLDAFIRANANSAVKAALSGMTLQSFTTIDPDGVVGSGSAGGVQGPDPSLALLLLNPGELRDITVTKY